MHPRVLAERNEAAHKRIIEAAGVLMQRFDVPQDVADGLSYTYRERDVQDMVQREAVSKLLAIIADAPAAAERKESEESNRLRLENQDLRDGLDRAEEEMGRLNARISELEQDLATRPDTSTAETVPAPVATIEPAPGQDLADMPVADLRTMAQARGIDIEGMKKADLITALQKAGD